jgi:hypothetical protein
MEATAAFAAVKDLPKKKSTTSEQVVAALMSDEPLFHFKDFSIKSIGE